MTIDNDKIGICRICKKTKKLSFEHIPPKVAFNKNTRYQIVTQEEYYKNNNPFKFKPKGNVFQGGLGEYCLCQDCNSFLGKNYVRPFSSFINVGMHLISSYEFDYIFFRVMNQNPLRILKHITSMFICISDPDFSEACPELLEFVINPSKNYLPEKYRFYLFLNNEGQSRKFRYPTFTYHHGALCELVFPPFGYVITLEDKELQSLTEITGFKNFSDSRNHELDIYLNRLPTFLHIPLDYRKKDEILKILKQ